MAVVRRLAREVDRRITRGNALPLAYTLTFACGAGDYFTGADVAFTLVYLVPIALATWYRARVHGTVVAVLCAFFATGIDVDDARAQHHSLGQQHIVWNDGGSLVLFVLFVLILDALRVYVQREEQDKRLAIDQLRHAERLNVVGKLAAGVAHELGTPLNLVLGNAELIAEEADAPEPVRARARTIVDQVGRMTRIIRQLLTFARKRGTATESADLAACVREGTALLVPMARKQELELVTEIADGPVMVRGSGVELAQVLNNLVINAIQATPSGGEVRVACAVRPGDARHPPTAAMTVSDTGTGIAAENVTRIFDPFFTTKEVGVGTGLGLSVTYGIVEDFGGRIEVDSRLGEGTRFTVTLPLAGEDA